MPLRWWPTRLLEQAEPEVEDTGHARVGDSIVQPRTVSPGRDDASIGKTLQLVGDGLWCHLDASGKIGDTQFSATLEGMQKPQAGVIRKDLKQAAERRCASGVNERAVTRRRFTDAHRDADGRGAASHTNIITLFRVIVSIGSSCRNNRRFPMGRHCSVRLGGTANPADRRLICGVLEC